MDTGILNVLPVQATLIPQVLLKLLLDEAHHGQPAGMWERRECVWAVTGHMAGKRARLARLWGVGSSFFVSSQRNEGTGRVLSEMWGSTGYFGARSHQKCPPPFSWDGWEARADQPCYWPFHFHQVASHIERLPLIPSPTPHQSEQSTESPKPGVSTKVSFTLIPPSSISTPRRSIVRVCVKRAVGTGRDRGTW